MADMHGTQLETVVLLKNTAVLDLNPPRGICSKGVALPQQPPCPPRWRGRPGSVRQALEGERGVSGATDVNPLPSPPLLKPLILWLRGWQAAGGRQTAHVLPFQSETVEACSLL